jgi:hypothetical protein
VGWVSDKGGDQGGREAKPGRRQFAAPWPMNLRFFTRDALAKL